MFVFHDECRPTMTFLVVVLLHTLIGATKLYHTRSCRSWPIHVRICSNDHSSRLASMKKKTPTESIHTRRFRQGCIVVISMGWLSRSLRMRVSDFYPVTVLILAVVAARESTLSLCLFVSWLCPAGIDCMTHPLSIP